MLGGGLWDVRLGFVALHTDGEDLAGLQAIQGETGADESHRAEMGGYVEFMVWPLLGVGVQVWRQSKVRRGHGLSDLTICRFTIAAYVASDVYDRHP